jgi:hypothetical protein
MACAAGPIATQPLRSEWLGSALLRAFDAGPVPASRTSKEVPMEPIARPSTARWLVPVFLMLVIGTAIVAVFSFIGLPLAGTWNALAAGGYACAITALLVVVMTHAAHS